MLIKLITELGSGLWQLWVCQCFQYIKDGTRTFHLARLWIWVGGREITSRFRALLGGFQFLGEFWLLPNLVLGPQQIFSFVVLPPLFAWLLQFLHEDLEYHRISFILPLCTYWEPQLNCWMDRTSSVACAQDFNWPYQPITAAFTLLPLGWFHLPSYTSHGWSLFLGKTWHFLEFRSFKCPYSLIFLMGSEICGVCAYLACSIFYDFCFIL